jgi:hypothetical protein
MAVLNCGHSTIVGLCASCAAEVRNADPCAYKVKPQGFYPIKSFDDPPMDQARRHRLLDAADTCAEEGFLEVAAQLRRIAAR